MTFIRDDAKHGATGLTKSMFENGRLLVVCHDMMRAGLYKSSAFVLKCR
jgi:hypothetical protein